MTDLAVWICVGASALLTLLLPLSVMMRFARSAERRRALWLNVNAQPRLSITSFGIAATGCVVVGFAAALGAIGGYAFLWLTVALSVSGLVCLLALIYFCLGSAPKGDGQESRNS